MGTMWTVWPLDDRMKEWLDKNGIEHPSIPSRFPTGKEIKEVVANLPGFNVQVYDNGVGKHWGAFIVSPLGGDNGEWADIKIRSFSGDDQEQQLYFEKGSESLIVLILKQLAQKCGPLVLITDAGGAPQIISSSTSWPS